MIKYGNDDIDLINRLELYGVKRYNIKKAEYCSVISHDNEERYSSKERLNNVFKVYIKYLSPNRSEIIFLFKNKKYERFVLKDEAESGAHNYQTTYLQKKYHYRYTIEDFLWEEGRWEQANSIILLTYGAGFDQKLVSTKSIKESEFYELSNTSLIDELSTFNYTQYNLNMMRKNLNDKKIQVNESNAFGSGVVYKNFDRKIGIEL